MFKKHLLTLEERLAKTVAQMGEKTRLRDACEYALMGKGKRLRPLLVLMIADALGHELDVMPVALSVEFFHTSSLIADDLPCMDNDDERRGRPALHKVFEEGIALLASFTFVASGYEGIYTNQMQMKADPRFSAAADIAAARCLEIATRCGGIKGVTNGQFLDLFPPNCSLQTIETIILQKTVTLFQATFVFGWLFGGGDPARQQEVEMTAYHLGMAFQIADDLQDMEQDAIQQCETNIALVLGREAAMERFSIEARLWKEGLIRLGLWNEDFKKAADFLYQLAPAACLQKPLAQEV